jgi:exosortase
MNGTGSGDRIFFSERFRLAALSRGEWAGIAGAAMIAAFLFILFHYMGNTVDTVNSRSAFFWMWARWQDTISFGGVGANHPDASGADYSHGILIPFVSIWAVWYRRRELLAASRQMDVRGLPLIMLALLMHWVGAKMQQTRISLMALVILLWAIPFLFWGWKSAKHLIFPVGYLIFCIPLNFLDVIAFPLRILAAQISAGTLNALGADVIREGSAIRALDTFGAERWAVDVAAPCSGLRSLLAMTALTSVYAWVTQDRQWKKWLLFMSSIPLAIAGNVGRIAVIGLTAETFGQKLATGVVHDFSGYVVFAVGIALMISLGALLKADVRKWWGRWRGQVFAPANA